MNQPRHTGRTGDAYRVEGAAGSLQVHAAGLCCALGYHLQAAVHALRANMDHFQASGFYTPTLERIKAASLPDTLYGNERLARWVEFAVRDCASRLDDPISLLCKRRTAVIVLAPALTRTHGDPVQYADIVHRVLARLANEAGIGADDPVPAQHRLAVVSENRTGLGTALRAARRLLSTTEADQVLLIGIDSYLNAGDINAALLEERLFVPGNSDGFVPGEAAAAVLLRWTGADTPGLHIDGIGMAHEPGRHDGSVPSRGTGLTQAIRAACGEAAVDPIALTFRISDHNGEQFFSKDAANAVTRVTFGGRKLQHLTIADKIGEVGAASGPAMLAWLLCDMAAQEHSPGPLGLLHLANDDGNRCAIVVRYQPKG